MKRRDFIAQTAKNFGYTVSAASMAQLLSACSQQNQTKALNDEARTSEATIQTALFSPAETQTLSIMADIIIPKTDTPSASEVGTIEFMTTFVKEVFSTAEQANFINGLQIARANILKQNQQDFIELSNQEQIQFVSRLDTASFTQASTDSPVQQFYKQFKRLTVLGYYQSEHVGETLLNYDPIPGGFIGCMPYDGKVMSLN